MTYYETNTQLWIDSFDIPNLEPMKMGFSGGVPTRFRLEKTIRRQDAGEPTEAYHIQITTEKMSGPNAIKFYGEYGYPNPGRENPNDYGHGTAGYIKNIPQHLRTVISEKTGIDLEKLQ